MFERTGAAPKPKVDRQANTVSAQTLHANWHRPWIEKKRNMEPDFGTLGGMRTQKKADLSRETLRQIGLSTEHRFSVNVHPIASSRWLLIQLHLTEE
jgi:hypothetical protein